MAYSSTSYGGTPHSGQSFSAKRNGEAATPRIWTTQGFLPFRLEVLTPVFIGSGEDLSPLEYVIRKEGDTYVLHIVDGAAWLAAEQQNSAVSTALNAGDLLKLRRLMDERLDEKLYSLARLPLSTVQAEKLRKHITNPSSRSEAEVQTFVQNPLTHTAIISGSSLKGALSTPLIDHLDMLMSKLRQPNLKIAAAEDRKYGYSNTMKAMFGGITEHAMQALKMGDIAVPPQGTRVAAAQEMRLNPEKPGTPKTPCECLPPSVAGGMPLYGHVHLDCRTGEPAITLPGGGSLSWKKITELCNAFYTRRFLDEWQTFYMKPHFAAVKAALAAVKKRVEALDPACEVLLRVGHYSHVECVTVTDNAPQAKKGFGKTRTLADGQLPFGWVVLRLCPLEEYRSGVADVENAILEASRKREAVINSREAALHEAVEQQRRKAEAEARARAEAEAEKLRREQEAAEREAALAALSPDDRAIAALSLPGAEEKQSAELFARIDSFDAALQTRAAAALKAYWEALGKWKGKLAPKQEKKVKRVKEILGE